MCITRYSLGHRLFCVVCMTFAMEALAAAVSGPHWSDIMVMLYEVLLWLCCYLMAAVSAGREVVLRLPRQPGDNKRAYHSYSSLRLLPVF